VLQATEESRKGEEMIGRRKVYAGTRDPARGCCRVTRGRCAGTCAGSGMWHWRGHECVYLGEKCKETWKYIYLMTALDIQREGATDKGTRDMYMRTYLLGRCLLLVFKTVSIASFSVQESQYPAVLSVLVNASKQ